MQQHQKAVETLLDRLVSPPILGYPDFSKPFVLHTDASQEGLGAVLYQKQEGKMRFIGYGSRSLTKAEKNYFLHSGKFEFGHRWVSELADFSFTIKYRPGHSNKDANALLRLPMDIDSYMKLCTENVSQGDIKACCVGVGAQGRGVTVWVSAVSNDPSLLNMEEVSLGSSVLFQCANFRCAKNWYYKGWWRGRLFLG